jgi:hypothetical protein
MTTPAAPSLLREFPRLLGGAPDTVGAWAGDWAPRRLWGCVAVIGIGAGLYGAAMGWWRSPWQALYNVVKFPLVILATTLGNALLNGMLAPLLGLDLHPRQSLRLVLMSFTIAAAILGAFAPILAFLTWNLPPMQTDPALPWTVYFFVQLTQVAVIALAGVAANARLFGALTSLGGGRAPARRVLLAWLAGNLFFGSQLCWIFRPFIGSPGLPVEFLRPNALAGNFYETVFRAAWRLLTTND